MGHKSNPIGLRLQINRTWDSRWYAEGRNYARMLEEDLKMRKYIVDTLPAAAISKVVIERPAKLARVSIYAARPGVIIGKKGADIEKLRSALAKMTTSDVKLNIVEIRKPEIDAKLVAQGIADQLVRRVAFRRAMKRAVQSAHASGCRRHQDHVRRSPWVALKSPAWNGIAKAACRLHTLRANIDYADCRSTDRLWHHRHQVLDLQGRDPGSRPARPGPADDGSANFRRPPGPLIEK